MAYLSYIYNFVLPVVLEIQRKPNSVVVSSGSFYLNRLHKNILEHLIDTMILNPISFRILAKLPINKLILRKYI